MNKFEIELEGGGIMRRKRGWYCFWGVVLTAFAVSFMKLAAFGVDPFQTLLFSLVSVCPISYGTLSLLLNGLLLLAAFVWGRNYIGINTFINLFLLGYMIQFVYAGLHDRFPAPGMAARLVLLGLGIVLLCAGNALYTEAAVGVSPYDCIALILANKWRIAKFKYCRMPADTAAVLSGLAVMTLCAGYLTIGSSVGMGTIVTALFTGPLVQFFMDRLRLDRTRAKRS